MKLQFIIVLSLILSFTANTEKINGIIITEKSSVVTIENQLISIRYDLQKGTYSAFDKVAKVEAIYNATTQINDFNSSESSVKNSYIFEPINEELGKGAAIVITSKKKNFPDQLFKIKLFDNQKFMVLQCGIKNCLPSSYVVKKLSPIANAKVFKGLDVKENFRLLDGEGGGAETSIRKESFLLSQNNLIMNFGNDKERHNLIAGGLTYQEFEKFAFITDGRNREKELSKLADKLPLMEYVDLGKANFWEKTKYCTVDKIDKIFNLIYQGGIQETKSIIYDKNELKISFKNLDTTKTYTLGLVMGAYDATVVQSIHLIKAGIETQILAPIHLPSLPTGDDPALYFIEITPEMMRNGLPTILVKNEEGKNCILNEMVLFEGAIPSKKNGIPLSAKSTISNDFENIKFNLYAEDPIGKLVDAGTSYLPDKDAFYLDFSTVNPIESAEKYAKSIKIAQDVKLNHYYFPTICLWYAMQPHYGGAGLKVRAINDSPGAVDEMQRVKESGWLKYTTMGIRLVPDCYDENNENGWWDDKHWQTYGSGDEKTQGGKGMELQKGHYREPYETSKKWAQAVLYLGGLPFFYMQTAVRSKDYCEQFPSHMLYNQSFYKVENQMDRMNKNYGVYDFTDTGFVAHMHQVYKNLHDAGIVGLMFDYPYTAWAPYGGMDDKYSTTAGMYRKVFELATNGLGEKSYVQERNLSRGSDLTVGKVQSQRIWGDTDGLNAEMLKRCGLRWYKNRVLFNYDMDSKSITEAQPSDSDDGINKLLTMSYVSSSRFLLSQSFGTLTEKQVYKLSRVFPFHQVSQSARPVDAFSSDYPRVYDFEVNSKWHQLTFYNEDNANPKTISVQLAGTLGFGGIGLNKAQVYYVFDFWNNQLVGEFKGDTILTQQLRKGEARMMSVRQKEKNPQLLSTDRHLMQGYLELSDVKWNNLRLSGKVELIEKEPMKIIIATNGMQPNTVKTSRGTSTFRMIENGLIELTLTSSEKGKVDWSVYFNDLNKKL